MPTVDTPNGVCAKRQQSDRRQSHAVSQSIAPGVSLGTTFMGFADLWQGLLAAAANAS